MILAVVKRVIKAHSASKDSIIFSFVFNLSRQN
jgi:hypothetical protein